jgi:hypothetical protein
MPNLGKWRQEKTPLVPAVAALLCSGEYSVRVLCVATSAAITPEIDHSETALPQHHPTALK